MNMKSSLTSRTAVLVALTLLAFASLGGGAVADDHEPPRAELVYKGEVIQQGVLTAFCWTTVPSPGQETHRCVDSPSTIYPEKVRLRPDSRVRIRIHKEQQPKAALLQTSKTAEGNERRMPLFLQPVVRDGETVAWDVVFDVCHADRHYYLRVGGVWEDEEGGTSNQDAIWNFHIKTKRT